MGEWNDGTMLSGGVDCQESSPELRVDELWGTEHLSLGAKGDSGTGV